MVSTKGHKHIKEHLPEGGLGRLLTRTGRRRDSRHVGSRGSAVGEAHLACGRSAIGGDSGIRRVNVHGVLLMLLESASTAISFSPLEEAVKRFGNAKGEKG